MRAASLPNDRRGQKTFTIALSLLCVVGCIQILVALYLKTRRPAEALPPARNAAVRARLYQQATPVPTPLGTPIQVPAVTGVPSASVPRVVPTPIGVPDTLLQVAKGFRERGDTGNAIAKLQQASALDPGNAAILAELALTYESMQLFDRSNEVWRRLQSLGSTAGPLAELANLKLRVGVPVAGQPLADQAGPAPVANSAGAAIPDGSTFGISEVTLRDKADPEAETELVLRVGVKVRPNTPIDHTKVKLQVFFYDVVNNDQVVLTNADVSYEWITPGHDWKETGIEILDVTYLRSKRRDPVPGTPLTEVPDSVEKAKLAERKPEKAAGLVPTSENGPRQYLGYIVRVYYNDQLQDVRANPDRLLQLFPPPVSAPLQ